MPRPRIGVVLAATGRLAPLGAPLEFVARALSWPVDVLLRDSGSTPEGARAATRSLVGAGARIVVTLGGTTTLPAVVEVCGEHEVPCVSTTLPWQVFASGRRRPGWAFHFCWGVDDIPLAGGQWRGGPRPSLAVVDNRRSPLVPLSGELAV